MAEKPFYLTTKIKRGHEYLYLEGRAWVNGQCRRTWQKYLGPKDKIIEQDLSFLKANKQPKFETEVFSFGLSAALWSITQELDLEAVINDILKKNHINTSTFGRNLIIAAINHGVAPCSKSKLKNWFKKDWISTRYSIDPSTLNAQTYWNQFHILSPEILQEIHLAIVRKILSLYPLETKSVFYDATNFFSFTQEHSNSSLFQFGHCKAGKNGNRLVGCNLLATQTYGIPLLFHVYPGNMQDAKSFRESISYIRARLIALNIDPHGVTLTFDKGNLSLDAFKIIDKIDVGFIASARNSTQKDLLEWPRNEFTSISLPITQKVVEYYRTTRNIYDKDRIVFVVFDPAKQARQIHLFNHLLEKKIIAINTFFQDRLNLKMWTKKSNVEAKVKSMIGKKPFKGILSPIITEEQDQMKLSLTLNASAKEKYEATLGRTILFTNRDTWSAEEVIWGYRQQYLVEHDFHYMKASDVIAIRPMRHWTNPSVQGHIFTCVLSLTLIYLLQYKLGRKHIPVTIPTLLEKLRSIHVTQFRLSPKRPLFFKMEKLEGITRRFAVLLHLEALLTQ